MRADLQAQRDVPVPVLVVLLEDIRHALEADARLHKQVEADCVLAAPVIRAVQQGDELRREAVPEGDERLVELLVRDVAGAVGVEAVEQAAPGREEAPEPAVAALGARWNGSQMGKGGGRKRGKAV